MKRFEPFLKSGYYIGFIFLVTLFAWSFYEETPPHLFNLYNMMVVFGLIALNTLLLISFENTLYTVPIVFSFLFIINNSTIDFNSVGQLGFPIIAFGVFILGYLIYFIKYKPKFKAKTFYWGLFLIGLSYVIPLIYTPFEVNGIMVSMAGFIYFGIYLFYSNTIKGNIDYLFKILLIVNLLLTAQVGLYLYRGYLLNPQLDFYHRIYAGWGRNLGWANINDMCFYIALTFPSYLYFIFKKPQTYLLWFMMLLPTAVVILSKSRGGIIGYAAVLLGVMLFFFFRGNKKHLFHGLIFLAISSFIAYQIREVFYIWWDFFLDSIGDDLNDFSTGRISIYLFGLDVFKQNPLFGGGWLSINGFPGGNLFGGRVFMYHSTIVQSLAAMGIFGFLALLFHYFQIAKYVFKHPTLEKFLFLIGYLASQAHGLIDNVQYAVPYSVLIVIILAVFETSEKTTSFESKKYRYHFIETN
ncbi:MAG: O-antigen ligase domain-containing protein [Acholeplasma sp.]|jgi:O-antigen ligase|nr:MAG: O-antigen ligase domain-containing protein [Acholeplasma sp.]